MDHYVDIRLLTDPEIAPHQLLSTLYARLHHALVQSGSDRVAVCFPDYDLSACKLGDRLRLVSSLDGLAPFATIEWLGGLKDQAAVDKASPVPANPVWRTIRRVQAKSSPERSRRRQLKRHGPSDMQTIGPPPASAPQLLSLPYVRLTSASTGQTFKMFLRLGPIEPFAIAGAFNTFGLSTSATIPWF